MWLAIFRQLLSSERFGLHQIYEKSIRGSSEFGPRFLCLFGGLFSPYSSRPVFPIFSTGGKCCRKNGDRDRGDRGKEGLKKGPPPANLMLTPTYPHSNISLVIEDYRLKEQITTEIAGGLCGTNNL